MRRASLEDASLLDEICRRDGLADANAGRWLADPRNIVLIEDDNAVLFLWRWVGIYEGHVLFAKRGKLAIDLGALCLDLMFKAGAQMILAVAAGETKKVRAIGQFLRRLGFTFKGSVETIEGLGHLYQLEASAWA